MQSPDASDHPASDGSDTRTCLRCGIPTAKGAAHCPGCLLRIGLEYQPGDVEETFDEPIDEDRKRASQAPRFISNYELLSEIGRGGMGVIYRARDQVSGRIVALKCLLDYHIDSRETVARFRREASASAMLQHPNILPVYEVGDSAEGVPFFTMRLITGGTLHRQHGGTAFSSVRDSVQLMAKVAAAVHFAHERGILHRDLKPGNILVDESGEPFVSDFGLAKWLHETDGLTRTLLVFGTPGYIAPEQAHGPSAEIRPAADVYSLGAMLFELLTGRPPFLGEHALAVLRQAAERTAPRLRTLAPRLDPQLETICARCLEREPSARYGSAGHLAADLERWLKGHRIAARPVPAISRAWRWARRNRAISCALAVALLCAAFAVARGTSNRNLQRAADENLLAARSAVMLPVLDLDTATPDMELTAELARSFEQAVHAIGPARIRVSSEVHHAGTSRNDLIQEAGRIAQSRTVIAGTKRADRGRTVVSFRVLDAATGDLVAEHTFASEPDQAMPGPWSVPVARELYSIIAREESGDQAVREKDPGLRDEKARQLIEAGRQLSFRYTRRELDQAIVLYEQALQLQPGSATARAFLSAAYTTKFHFTSDSALLARAEDEARKALELAPRSGDAHRVLAGVMYKKGQLHGALEELFETAALCGVEQQLEEFIGMCLDTVGQPDRAMRWYQRAARSSSQPADIECIMADAWVRLGQDEMALRSYRRAEALQPNLPNTRVGMAHLFLMRGEFEEARRHSPSSADDNDLGDIARMAAQIEFFARDFQKAAELYGALSKAEPDGGGSFYGAINYDAALGRSLQALGRVAEAEAMLRRSLETERAIAAQQPSNPKALYRLAALEATLGMRDPAVQHLRAAVDAGWLEARSLALDPRFDAIRLDDQFQQIVLDLNARRLQITKGLENTPVQ